jgi:hypothetical protein
MHARCMLRVLLLEAAEKAFRAIRVMVGPAQTRRPCRGLRKASGIKEPPYAVYELGSRMLFRATRTRGAV